MIRVQRSTAGREVLSAVERLMDGLLVEEEKAAAAVGAEVHRLAVLTEARVLAVFRASGRPGVIQRGMTLLPSWETVDGVLEAPVGELLARTRHRTLETLNRQLRACEESAAQGWSGLAKRAGLAASAVASDLERHWLEMTLQGAQLHWQAVIIEAGRQHQYWMARNETKEELVARWCSSEPTRLPGCGRGAMWGLVPGVVELARRGSVATVNGLLMAGYEGWNRAVDAAEAS